MRAPARVILREDDEGAGQANLAACGLLGAAGGESRTFVKLSRSSRTIRVFEEELATVAGGLARGSTGSSGVTSDQAKNPPQCAPDLHQRFRHQKRHRESTTATKKMPTASGIHDQMLIATMTQAKNIAMAKPWKSTSTAAEAAIDFLILSRNLVVMVNAR